MTLSLERNGECLCGAVSYNLRLKSTDAHVCHCSICRRSCGGSPAIAIECQPDSLIFIKGEENLKWYKSSEEAERGFCVNCGTGLFFRLDEAVGHYLNVSAGSLENQDGVKIAGHIFIDNKPDYYDFKDDAPRLTEEEFLKQIGAT
jgi:hypothetical protein